MKFLYNFKTYLKNALLNNQKFCIIPYYKKYYILLLFLFKMNYIKNYTCINFFSTHTCYIIIEFKYFKGSLQKFKIIIFKNKLLYKFIKFQNILKLSKFSGHFIFDTSLGTLVLDQIKLYKVGGKVILYVYKE